MDLSVIIRVKDDVRVKNCVESIDEDLETVVVLNTPSDAVRDIVGKLKVKTTEIKNNNLAKAHNVGITASSYDNVLLMDSDCVFDRGCIRKLYDCLDKAPLSKGKVLFDHKTPIGKIVALSREYHVSDIVNAYAPSLAFRKNIKDCLGGYFFDEDLFWTEDHEFDQRVKKAGLQITYVPDATITHDELSFASDLRSSFHYGTGYFEGVKKGVTTPCFMYGGSKTIFGSIGHDVLRAASLPVFFVNVARKKGILPAAFMSLWMMTFSTGYYAQGLFNVLGVKK